MGIELFLITLIAITVATISLLLINYWDRLYNNREESTGGYDEILDATREPVRLMETFPMVEISEGGFVTDYRDQHSRLRNDSEFMNASDYHTTQEEECTNCEKGIIGYKNGKNKYGCIHCGNKM